MSTQPATDAAVKAPAVELQEVSVRYFVPKESAPTLKEHAIRRLRGRIEKDEFVALNGVSATIYPGERVGVIGPNGAGKSTLFRAIARVRRPSSGRVIVRGRVAPLLELGLGFHHELTGRENVILQGAMMGFSRREMEGRMDSIVQFAELEDFVDSPVRTYSNGMIARLGFSVATDVDPDILLVDEILAVGDVRFRAKCYDRMSGFRQRGKTFLLVSHALQDVVDTCQRALWIEGGRVVRDGAAAEVVREYVEWCGPGLAKFAGRADGAGRLVPDGYHLPEADR
jgi:ABC-type polysaccharide/polyol phosphate transport system ATPase subunit